MPGILDDIKSLFGKTNLYDVLDIAKTSSPKIIKKAYYKISLTVHPDKCDEKDRKIATQKFQILGKIYSILSDDNLRAVYDETGCVEDEDSAFDEINDWCKYWKTCFSNVSFESIEKFSVEYKGSDEERKDLIKLYEKHKGDMDSILDEMMCSSAQDEPRFRTILDELIQNGEVEDYDVFTREAPKRKKIRLDKYESEKQEAAEMLKELKKKGSGEGSLEALITRNMRSRQENADSFLDRMEQKYSTQAKNKSKTTKSKTGKTSKKSK